ARWRYHSGARPFMGSLWGDGPVWPSCGRTAASQHPVFVDAEEGNRTPKPLRAGDFESPASASSATSARCPIHSTSTVAMFPGATTPAGRLTAPCGTTVGDARANDAPPEIDARDHRLFRQCDARRFRLRVHQEVLLLTPTRSPTAGRHRDGPRPHSHGTDVESYSDPSTRTRPKGHPTAPGTNFGYRKIGG